MPPGRSPRRLRRLTHSQGDQTEAVNTNPGSKPKARPTATRSAASSATSLAASGTSYARPPRSKANHSHHQFLDIGAAIGEARAGAPTRHGERVLRPGEGSSEAGRAEE